MRHLIGLLILLSVVGCGKFNSVKLEPGFSIYINDTSSVALNTTLEILQRDLKIVLGRAAVIKTNIEEVENSSNTLVIINGEADNITNIGMLEGFEQHKLFIKDDNLVLQGSDLRGTLFAIYTFSEKFLGIKPLWFWASQNIPKKQSIEIPQNFNYDSGEPYVKYRTWFPNDQDMFDPWREKGKINNEILYETLLRLKLNTLEIEKSIDYSEPGKITDRAKLLKNYGLIMTFHHHSPMNSKLSDWEKYWKMMGKKGSPKFKLSFSEELAEFWRYNVKTLVDHGIDDVIWGINFRGNGDRPFWLTFEDSPESMEDRAKVINNMVNKQLEILKEVTGSKDPLTRMIFYDEISDLLAEGLLKIPEGKNVIWNYVAARRDHFPNEDIRSINLADSVKLGYYLNLQFTSTGSHLVQAEGPWKMERNYRYVDSKNAEPVSFSVVNAGNIREHVLTLSANADMLWNFNNYNTDQFLAQFSSTYFGDEHKEAIVRLYEEYFNAYWNQKKNDLKEFPRQYIFHDLRYKQVVKQLSNKFDESVDMNPLEDYSWEQLPNRTFRIVPEDHGTSNQMEALIKGTEESFAKFSTAAKKADLIYSKLKEEEKTFFNDNIRMPAHFMMHLNETVNSFCRAYIYNSENGSNDQRALLVNKAYESALKAREILFEAEHGKFDTWYSEENIFDIDEFVENINSVRKIYSNNDG